jgi:hypothetical protein
MKTSQIFKLIAVPLLMVLITLQLQGQIKGDGNLIKQERNVPSFTSLDVSSGIDVIVTQGSKQSVVIQAEQNLQELIITEVSGSTLYIYVKKGTNIWQSKGMDAYITVTGLQSVNVSGGGDIESQSMIKADNIALNISGGGDLSFEIDAAGTSCKVSGGGDADIIGTIGACDLQMSGGGDMKLEAGIKELNASVSGGGDAVIRSSERSGNITVSVTGGGDLSMNVNADNIMANIGGGGDAAIKAETNTGNAEVTVSGGGDLQMELAAEKVKIAVSGGGDAFLKGTAQNLDAAISSGSDMDATGFKTVNARVNLSGGSDAKLNVTGTLDISASGGGQVYLTGNPEIKNSSLSGGSEIHNQ